MITACCVHTPVGDFTALYDDGVIRRILFPNESLPANAKLNHHLPFASQVAEYFAGKRKSFNLPVLIPGTPFRQDVYRTVMAIPYGEVAAYSDVAFTAGYPLAMRAVGSAMKANPLPLILPCHRVVHKAKNKDAYRGGTGIKAYLLSLEEQYK